jgi:non-lysosomal glucosylceramidase
MEKRTQAGIEGPIGHVPAASPSCCCGGACGDDVNRREFMQAAGAGILALSAGRLAEHAAAASAASDENGIQHFVPADKQLARSWLTALTERGGPRVLRGRELELVGMPVGGITVGQLYLRGDGTLGCWQIFNQRYFSGYGRDNYRPRKPDAPVDQGFAVVLDRGRDRAVRRLNAEDFDDVEFTGEYPIGLVRYRDEDFPATVRMEAFSPFIPLNAVDSALPATLVHVTVENTSPEPVQASLLSWLENAVCFHSAPDIRAVRRSRVVSRDGRAAIVHAAEATPPPPGGRRPDIVLADFEGADYGGWVAEGEAFGTGPARGTLPHQQPVGGFRGKGLVNTFLEGDRPQGTLTSPEFVIARDHVNFLIGGGGHAGETCINLIVDDVVERTATGQNQETLLWDSWDVRELAGRTARIRIVDASAEGWGHINVDQIELSDEPRRGSGKPVEQLEDYGTLVLMADAEIAPDEDVTEIVASLPPFATAVDAASTSFPVGERRSTAMLSRPVRLAPGARHTFTVALAWHFPNREHGQAYAVRFADAEAVAAYVLDNRERLAGDTRLWHETYYGGTLPRWLLDRLHSTVGNLATGTCQWWADGRFWAWEGVGCCHGTCTHVWNYAQAVARLFPELERSARRMQDLGVALQENGLVGFRGEPNGAYAADGQAGTVLKCYREHLMSADEAFLRTNWPKIKRVLLYSIERDENDDGLIESSQHNTYDINFFGPNTFVGSLYLAALRAGEAMALLMGDDAFAARLRRIFERGSRSSVERLYTGEYFIQEVDLDAHPKHQYGLGCLSDQLFGQGWAHQLGLGYLYPPDVVKQTLHSIWTYNWAPDVREQNEHHPPERWFVDPGEAGLFTCTWPHSPFLSEGVRYRNEVWTGIEYQVAGHLAWEGMVTEALAIVRAVHDRYHPLKRNPYNEVECGDHYARALASWGVYTALCGYAYDGPRGHLGFAPRLTPEDFRAAFTAAEGWGAFSQQREGAVQRERIEVRRGRLRVETLAFEIPRPPGAPQVTVTLAGRPLAASARAEGTTLRLELARPAVVSAGETLEVTCA